MLFLSYLIRQGSLVVFHVCFCLDIKLFNGEVKSPPLYDGDMFALFLFDGMVCGVISKLLFLEVIILGELIKP